MEFVCKRQVRYRSFVEELAKATATRTAGRLRPQEEDGYVGTGILRVFVHG